MKFPFSRWLPAIATTSYRKTALTAAGLAVVGGLAVAPAAIGAPVTSGPNPGAVAAINLATGQGTPDKAVANTPDKAVANTPDKASATALGIVYAADDKPAGTDPDTAGKTDQKDTKPSMAALVPYGVQGAQSWIALDDAQLANAKAIVEVAKAAGVGERGAVIGVATALQESKLYNLGHLGAINDHDSQGLFQQRPSAGWGTPEQITNPDYASRAFFRALRNVPGWDRLPLTVAAQNVQVSAYPFAYAQWEQQAADIVQQVWAN